MTKRSRLSILVLVVILALMAPLAGCKKKQPETEPAPPPVETTPPPPPPPAPTPVPTEEPKPLPEEPVETMSQKLARIKGMLEVVHFAFDRYDLDDQNRALLKKNADVLKSNADVTIVIEGHCDERGTIEYNIALGERRANSVRDYLTSLGVDSSRMRIISYGEEKPEDLGSNEAAWAKNRRAEFQPEG